MSTEESIKAFFRETDVEGRILSETLIASSLRRLSEQLDLDPTLPGPIAYEIVGFSLVGNVSNQDYYGPAFRGEENGADWCWPNPETVSKEALDYWRSRLPEVKHPFLRMRYADLVWALLRKRTGQRPEIALAHAVIDSTIKFIELRLYRYELSGISSLGRALSIALAINDKVRISAVIQAILDYEDLIAESIATGTWGFSYDLILSNKKVGAEEKTKERILLALEKRFAEACLDPVLDSRKLEIAKHAMARLLSFYRRLDRRDEIRRIATTYGRAVIAFAGQAPGIGASSYLRDLYFMYASSGFKDEAEALFPYFEKMSGPAQEEMGHFSFEVEMPGDDVVNPILEELAQMALEDNLAQLANFFVPTVSDIYAEIEVGKTQAPLDSAVSGAVWDSKGRPVASVGTSENDPSGRSVQHIFHHIHFDSPLLRRALVAFIGRKDASPDAILACLFRSPVFREDHRRILREGLEAYFGSKYISAVHLLVPQIEACVREVLSRSGGSPFKPGPKESIDLKTLDEMLREPKVITVLDESTCVYLRALLTDRREWNVRNKVCHGMISDDECDSSHADRVFHALLIFAQLRIGEAGTPVP